MSGMDGVDVHELEGPTRCSRSLLWRLQRASYEAQGPLAWRPGGVPLQVTSNPFIARAYAAIIAGLVRDLRATGALTRPLRVVELGAGSGRFGYYLLRALDDAFARDGESPCRVIMTDVAERNVAAWRAHPKLAPYLARGVCDVARFDVEAPAATTLRVSGEALDADDAGEPIVAIANYVLDSVAVDAYRVEAGGLRERLVALAAPVPPELALLDPATTIEAMTWRLVDGARVDAADPEDADAAARAATAAAAVDGTTVLWPVAAAATLAWLARAGGGRLLVLASDKGHREPALRGARDDLALVRHGGCVSLPVDFDALARIVEARGGFALPATQRHDGFYSGVLGVGLDARALPRCQAAVDDMERFGPGDYQRLVDHAAVAAEGAAPSIERVLTLLRLGSFDPRLLARFADELSAALRGRRPDWLDRDLADALDRARDLHYPVPGRRDGLLVVIGTLLFQLGEPARAVVALEQALDGSEADAATHVKLALCWARLERAEEARAAVARALAIAPAMPEAQRLAIWLAGGVPDDVRDDRDARAQADDRAGKADRDRNG